MAPRTILVVDDDEDIRTLVELALSRPPCWRVLHADSGPAALELLQRERPDLVLLDVTMPGMDGIETLRALRAAPEMRDLKVVLATAQGQRHELARLAELGCEVVRKPFDPLALGGALAELVRRSSALP